MSKRLEQLRWRVATLMDKVPGQCWSRLADWAGQWRDYDAENPRGVPWARQDWMCRKDAARVGSCYCGKLQREPVPTCGLPVMSPSRTACSPCCRTPGHTGVCDPLAQVG